jgi:hypothetical protein
MSLQDLCWWDGRYQDQLTHPFRQALLFSSCSLIIPTMISSLTRPPASMIFFACTPSGVFWATCSRNMSPVARWHTQNSSRILGACVPLPERIGFSHDCVLRWASVALTSPWRTYEDRPKLMCWRLRDSSLRLCFESVYFVVELGNERLEVFQLV